MLETETCGWVSRYDYIPVAMNELLYFTVALKSMGFAMIHFPSYIMPIIKIPTVCSDF